MRLTPMSCTFSKYRRKVVGEICSMYGCFAVTSKCESEHKATTCQISEDKVGTEVTDIMT